jgi:hypothetical protein
MTRKQSGPHVDVCGIPGDCVVGIVDVEPPRRLSTK